MRASWLLFGLLVLGCGAKPPAPTGGPFRASDAAASYAAYQEYCGMCPKAETCCLTEGDFATSSWSASSGTYLRAMRDYYWCQRSAVLYHTLYDPAPVTPVTDEFGPLTSWGHVSQSCYAHACNDFSDVMVAELDKALATHRLKSQGALVSCSNPELL